MVIQRVSFVGVLILFVVTLARHERAGGEESRKVTPATRDGLGLLTTHHREEIGWASGPSTVGVPRALRPLQ